MFEEDEFPEDNEPTEGDWVTEDHVHFRTVGGHRRDPFTILVDEQSHDGAGFHHRKRVAREGDVSDASMWRQIDAEMARQKFWPNVWFVSDHGNAHLMTRPKREKKTASRNHRRG